MKERHSRHWTTSDLQSGTNWKYCHNNLHNMKVKKLISELMEGNTSDEVYVRTEKGLKKVKAVIPTESDDDNPARYFTELMLED